VSAYNFAKQGGTQLVPPLPNEVYSSEVFSSFELFVKEWLPAVDLSKEDVVFEPQYKYVCNDAKRIIVDYIGKVESVDDDVRHVEKLIGRKIKLGNLNKSQRKQDYREYFDKETKQIIVDIYQDDIKLFNYTF